MESKGVVYDSEAWAGAHPKEVWQGSLQSVLGELWLASSTGCCSDARTLTLWQMASRALLCICGGAAHEYHLPNASWVNTLPSV